MGLMALLNNEPPASLHIVGLAIGRSGPQQNHVGLIYKRDDDVWACHLRWHHLLSFEAPEQAFGPPVTGFLWANLALPDAETLRAVAAVIGAIEVAHPDIPYGFSWDGDAFNPDGTLIQAPLGQGLTCATFVLKVLRAAGVELIDFVGWQDQQSDQEWRDKIIGMLNGRNVDPSHIDALKRDVSARRVKPEDVVGAGMQSPKPVPAQLVQETAVKVAQEVGERLPEPA